MQYTFGTRRVSGVAVPLASIRTQDGWCVGEYPDLVTFGRFARAIGATLVQILPVNDTGSQSSPYSALSAFALHPLYIRVPDLPEFTRPSASSSAHALADARIGLHEFARSLPSVGRFGYEACLNAKLRALRAVFDAAYDSIIADSGLADFIKNNEWVMTYAVYKRLKAGYGEKSWRDWPERRKPAPLDIAFWWNEPDAVREQLFHAWVQYRAADQFSEAARQLADLGVALLGDIPILMNDDSADVWANGEYFDTSMRAGAPPDMYSATGQNWGFPLYDWDAMAAAGHSFWKARVAAANNYYSAFRIDHVLGFFRIWALGDRDETGSMGRFIPGPLVTKDELASLGFSDSRIRWLSEPHLPGSELRDVVSASVTGALPLADGESSDAGKLVFDIIAQALVRIGDEDLYLFGANIQGEKDITSLGLPDTVSAWLKERWRDRALLPAGAGLWAPVWTYRDSRAWRSLSDTERNDLSYLFDRRRAEAEAEWETRGRELLAMLKAASPMLPCAEDLGAVPDCVPRVLSGLGIPGLRIPRWMRSWNEPGQPFIPLKRYETLSVCTPSVHDTSTLRGWWEKEEGSTAFAEAYCPAILKSSAGSGLTPEAGLKLLATLSKAPSMLFVVQVQDLLDTTTEYRSANPDDDRINIPGTTSDFNWTWRMPVVVETLMAGTDWLQTLRTALAQTRS